MTEDTQKFLKHLPDLKFESQQTEAKGLGVITTYFVTKKRTAVRPQKSNMHSIEDLENDEEEKESHESELFADSDDSRIKRIENVEETKNQNADTQGQNYGKSGTDNIEQSIIMDQDVSDNGLDNEKEKAKSIVFELPKYLI
jgi:hypothetical protein